MTSKQITLEKFQGPLDLLLQLIENEKLAITEISLSEVTDQFFKHLAALEGERSEELADFLVIATRLVYIKSRQLLPYLYPPEEEGPSLAEQLKFYKRYADASHEIEKLWDKCKMAYGRIEPPLMSIQFAAPLNAAAVDLQNSFFQLLRRLKPINPLPEIKIDRTVSIEQKIKSIFSALSNLESVSFKQLLDGSISRSEVIVSFLAVLELVKNEKVAIDQSRAFHEMMIRRI